MANDNSAGFAQRLFEGRKNKIMGWKTLKQHYRIGHAVQVVPDKGICIGSPYIHDLIVIGVDGQIIKADYGRVNEDLRRYMAEFKSDPDRLREVIQATDTFEKAITVYTWDGANILEKKCEKLGWPNVTHDGAMMYANTFSDDKNTVVKWAKENARGGIKWKMERVEDIKKQLSEMESLLAESRDHLKKLEAQYPENNHKQP